MTIAAIQEATFNVNGNITVFVVLMIFDKIQHPEQFEELKVFELDCFAWAQSKARFVCIGINSN